MVNLEYFYIYEDEKHILFFYNLNCQRTLLVTKKNYENKKYILSFFKRLNDI